MPLGNNRDYTTRDQDARRHLAVWNERMKELISAGMEPSDASAMTTGEMRNGMLKDRLKAWVDPILAHRRAMRKANEAK